MSTPTLSAVEAIEKVSKAAPTLPDTRVIKSMNPGEMIRQGDIYVINVTGLKQMKVFNGTNIEFKDFITKLDKEMVQLVPGSTMGSRHVAIGVSVFVNPTNRNSLVGPILKASHSFKITHPEHAHFELPAGDYLICYQLNDKTKERVRD